jgi:excisionase family DNA binding protein
MMDTKSKLLTVSDVAEYLAITIDHARKMCRAKALPAFKVGSDFRVDPSDFNVYLAGLKAKAGVAA